MAVFGYKGYDKKTGVVQGEIEAGNRIQALSLLEQQGVFPVRLDQIEPHGSYPEKGGKLLKNKCSSSVALDLDSLPGTVKDSFDEIGDWLDKHRRWCWRVLSVMALLTILVQMFSAFPVGSMQEMVLVGILQAVLAFWSMRAGLCFFLITYLCILLFHSPLIGIIFLFGLAPLTFAITASPRCALLVFMTPLLLQTGFGFSIPLGVGLFLNPCAAFFLSAAAAVTGLCYMAVTGIEVLGPLEHNHNTVLRLVGIQQAGAEQAFWQLNWFRNLSVSDYWSAAIQYLSDTFLFSFRPPVAVIEIATWGLAAFLIAKLSFKGGRHIRWCVCVGMGFVFLLQDVVVSMMPESPGQGLFATGGQLTNALVAISILILITGRVHARNRISETTFGELPEGGKWDNIGGLDDVKKEIQMAVQYLFDKRTADLAKQYGIKTIKGILFYGPPGCGKTLFAKAIAGNAGASFFSITGADFRSKWFGVAEQNLAKAFAEARKHAPSVLFFDEIEQMLGKREETITSDSPERRIVAQFLSEMDGVKELRDVLVIGATNEPDLIDPAALRPGRFDKLIYIPLPDEAARAAIFRVQLAGKPLDVDVSPERLAKITERYSGADISDLCTKVAEQSLHASLQSNHTVHLTAAAFERQIKCTKPSVSLKLLEKYDELREKYNRRTLEEKADSPEKREQYTWDKIGGLSQVRTELEEAISLPLKRPDAYERFAIRPPKGVMLFGPPGCGKTLMAKIVAKECHAHFLSVDTKKEKADSIKDWFIRARENKPCVLFFDEIDALGLARTSIDNVGYEKLTQLLIEMDGMKDLKQVVVVAATNRPEALDGALLRPGRFDKVIYVPPPDTDSRKQIMRIHLAQKPLSPDIDFDELAAQTEGFSGADLALLCYEVSMNLIRCENPIGAVLRQNDFVSVLKRLRPSITHETREAFENLKERFQRG